MLLVTLSVKEKRACECVWHTTYTVGLSVKVLYYTIDVCVQFALVLKGDGLLAAIGAEDNMVVRCCVTHTIYNVELGCLLFLWRASGTLVLGWCFVPRTALRLCGVTRMSCLRHEESA